MAAIRKQGGFSRLPVMSATFVVLVCLVIVAMSSMREWTSRSAEIANIELELGNLAQSLTQHSDDTLELADTILTGVVSRLEAEGTGAASVAKLQTILDLRKPTLGRIRGLFVYDDQGRWLATTEPVSLSDFNNSDADYFRFHRDSRSSAPHVGAPIRSRSGGQWIITLSRRVNAPDGSFAGVALASINVDYFADYYRKFDVGRNGAIALLSTDAFILARTPANESLIGRNISSSLLFSEERSQRASGAFTFRSTVDGTERLSFYYKSSRFPVMVLVSKDKNEALSRWSGQARSRTALVIILVLLIAATGAYLVRQLLTGQRMAAALAAQEVDFRVVAEGSSDMVTRIDLAGGITYVSPSAERIVGWRADQLIGTPALAGVNAADLPGVEKVVDELRAGDYDEARLLYRTRQREKGEIWLESTMRITRSPTTGKIDGVVAISRDMTDQKDLEDRLATLATTDGMTGLANRRCFDAKLAEEWARARRSGAHISLLMIDVDHFKKFNDTCGHPAGDACLQAIAASLANHARRPGDLAARYGGEEFAVLLPDTDAAGCRVIGEQIRTAVRALAIPHLTSPLGQVTVSIGGAVFHPGADSRVDGLALVEAADHALYDAKRTGRDRMAMSAELFSLDTAAAS